MRTALLGPLLALSLLTVLSHSARAAHGHAPSPVTLKLSVGYGNVYRGSAWTPVRVTASNNGNSTISGVLEVPQSPSGDSTGGVPDFHGLYQHPVLLPAGVTKTVTLYLPGSGLPIAVHVDLRQGTRILGTARAYPVGMDSSTLLIGVLGGGPATTGWLAPAAQRHVTAHIVPLSIATIDTLPAALSTLDLIVLTDTDTSGLDAAQLNALLQFARNGGSIILVGGPRWQETLSPLSPLLPGTITATHILPNLNALRTLSPLGALQGPQAAPVSVLSHPQGVILAQEHGIPLAVRRAVGSGAIEYLAFDPALNPVLSWPGASALLAQILADAAPAAVTRTWSQQGFRSRFDAVFGRRSVIETLANVPPSTFPFLVAFALLTILYLVLVGPVNFLLLRALHRQHFACLTIPILSLLFVGMIAGIGGNLRGSQALVNSIGVVTLTGSPHARPATVYLGLAAPFTGSYTLSYRGPSLPDPIPQTAFSGDSFFRSTTPYSTSPLGMRLQEGATTQVSFPALKQWQIRDLALAVTVNLPGSVTSSLRIDPAGTLRGTITNSTALLLHDPALVAGQNVVFLPSIPAGATIYAHINPTAGNSGEYQPSIWQNLYGVVNLLGDFAGFGLGDCCQQAALPPEVNLRARVLNAASMLGQTQSQLLENLGAVVLVGWTDRPLTPVSVDGSTPQQRSLTMIAVPLSVHLPTHGPFVILPGTVNAHLIGTVPRPPQSTTFGQLMRRSQQLTVGPGGSLTFEFDLPPAARVHYHSLHLSVAFGDTGAGRGSVYNWTTHRWTPIDLSGATALVPDAAHSVSASGRLLMRMSATQNSGDITISDITQDLQVSASGRVG